MLSRGVMDVRVSLVIVFNLYASCSFLFLLLFFFIFVIMIVIIIIIIIIIIIVIVIMIVVVIVLASMLDFSNCLDSPRLFFGRNSGESS